MRGGYNARIVDEENKRKEYYKNKKIEKYEVKNGVPLIKYGKVEKEGHK